jgi:hypothetical protein
MVSSELGIEPGEGARWRHEKSPRHTHGTMVVSEISIHITIGHTRGDVSVPGTTYVDGQPLTHNHSQHAMS